MSSPNRGAYNVSGFAMDQGAARAARVNQQAPANEADQRNWQEETRGFAIGSGYSGGFCFKEANCGPISGCN